MRLGDAIESLSSDSRPLKGRPCLRLMDLSIRVMEESLRSAGCADAIVDVHELANTNHCASVMLASRGVLFPFSFSGPLSLLGCLSLFILVSCCNYFMHEGTRGTHHLTQVAPSSKVPTPRSFPTGAVSQPCLSPSSSTLSSIPSLLFGSSSHLGLARRFWRFWC